MTHLLWCETFTGAASLMLQLLGGVAPAIGYMGSKRRDVIARIGGGV